MFRNVNSLVISLLNRRTMVVYVLRPNIMNFMTAQWNLN